MSYKGFDPDFKCRGKQYEEGKIYEEHGGTICSEGLMHYCDEPFDVWDYYGPVAEDGRLNTFAEVEPLGEVATAGNKRGTTKLKIGAKLSLSGFVKIAVDFLLEKTKGGSEENDNGEKNAQIGSSGYGAKIGSSGDGAKIVSEGEKSVICCAGHGCTVSAKAGSWITLAEWKENEATGKWEPLTVRTFYVDGETVKADTPYKLEGGELKEVKG